MQKLEIYEPTSHRTIRVPLFLYVGSEDEPVILMAYVAGVPAATGQEGDMLLSSFWHFFSWTWEFVALTVVMDISVSVYDFLNCDPRVVQ